MGKMKNMLVLLLVVIVAAVTVELFAEQSSGESDFSIKKSEAQTVLYTVYRGQYEKMGDAISKLYGLAGKKKIIPRGPVATVHLNNPQNTSQEHFLTEIRIPVGDEAMQYAGKLGEMTDIKTLQPMDVAVMKKQPKLDYSTFYRRFYERITKEGYRPTDGAITVFPSAGPASDYSELEAEISVPVSKIGAQ
jgi:effector-binding domain-containing protein